MPNAIDLTAYIAGFAASPLARWGGLVPWEITARAAEIVRELLVALPAGEFAVEGEVAIHRSATVEAGAVLKGPLIIGAGCFVAAGAYLRGGNWVGERCTLGRARSSSRPSSSRARPLRTSISSAIRCWAQA